MFFIKIIFEIKYLPFIYFIYWLISRKFMKKKIIWPFLSDLNKVKFYLPKFKNISYEKIDSLIFFFVIKIWKKNSSLISSYAYKCSPLRNKKNVSTCSKISENSQYYLLHLFKITFSKVRLYIRLQFQYYYYPLVQ